MHSYDQMMRGRCLILELAPGTKWFHRQLQPIRDQLEQRKIIYAIMLSASTAHNNSWFAQKELNDAFSVTALIYEYELSENSVEAYLLRSSDLPGRVHLERSRIWEFLQNRP